MVHLKVATALGIISIIAGSILIWYGLNQNLTSSNYQIAATTFSQEATRSASASAQPNLAGDKAVVTRVIDGDTIVVNNNQKVRFLGMDTPETVDPKRPVGCFGKEASDETKSLLTGKTVILQKDVSNTDKYGRLLRFIYLPLDDGTILFVDDFLVREGFAKVLTIPPDVKYQDQFTQAQTEAKTAKRGLWGKC